MTENGGFQPLFGKPITQSISNLMYTLVRWVFRIVSLLVPCWPNLGPLVAEKNCWKWWFPTNIWKTNHSVHFKLYVYTCWASVPDKCAEMIWFWATLAHLRPSNGQNITENGGFWPSSKKLIAQSMSDLAYVLVRWVFRSYYIFGDTGPILALWWWINCSNWWFHLFQTWCTHWLGESSELVRLWPCWLNFSLLVAISVLSLPLIRPQGQRCILWCLVSLNKLSNKKLSCHSFEMPKYSWDTIVV